MRETNREGDRGRQRQTETQTEPILYVDPIPTNSNYKGEICEPRYRKKEYVRVYASECVSHWEVFSFLLMFSCACLYVRACVCVCSCSGFAVRRGGEPNSVCAPACVTMVWECECGCECACVPQLSLKCASVCVLETVGGIRGSANEYI